jgi:methyl-accepting chemotaxis protein
MKLLTGLRLKLLLLSAIPLFCLCVVGFIGSIKASDVSNWVSLIGLRNVPQLITSYEIQEDVISTLRHSNGIFMSWENPEKRNKFLTQARKSLEDMKEQYRLLSKIEMIPEVKTLYDKAAQSGQVFQEDFENIYSRIEKSNFTVEERNQFIAEIGSGKASQSKEQCLQDSNILVQKVKSLINERSKSSVAAAESAKFALILGVIVAFILSSVFLIIFFRSIFSKLGQVQKALSEASTQVQTAAEHLSSASQQLSESASESAASLEESVASMQELSSMVQANAGNSQQASQLSQKGGQAASHGEADMGALSERMHDIQSSASKMEQIIAVIDDIAFQTNLLALNAAVEAARAGDQGKGFSVVAEAVRALAQKSAASAKEIAELIKESSEKVAGGVEMTDRSKVVFQEIVTSIQQISQLNEEIARASQEQAQGVSQATTGMNQLDQGVQSNAATAEEIAASAEELSTQVLAVRTTVEELNQLIDGSHNSSGEMVRFPERKGPSQKQQAA